jgi:hypothetical protein
MEIQAIATDGQLLVKIYIIKLHELDDGVATVDDGSSGSDSDRSSTNFSKDSANAGGIVGGLIIVFLVGTGVYFFIHRRRITHTSAMSPNNNQRMHQMRIIWNPS